MTESSIGEKENEQIKGLISNIWLFLLHNTTHVGTKFQNPNPSNCLEIFDGKKFTDKQTSNQTNIITEKGKNYIPPTYFVPGV